MKTKIAKIKDLSDPDLLWAAELIKKGEIVAFPTETVYGLGADALDPQAVKKIYVAKGRPSDNPLIVHIASVEQLYEVAAAVPETAELLAERFWPGPLTMILPKSEKIPPEITAGLDTVAIRMPNHPVALELIRKSGLPIAAPSANLSGKPSPTSAKHVAKDLYGRIALILDGGETIVGLESTVLDLCGAIPTVLRPGGVTAEELRDVLGDVRIAAEISDNDEKPRSPGMKYTHYKPAADVLLFEGPAARVAEKMNGMIARYKQQGRKAGLLVTSELAAMLDAGSCEIRLMGSRDDLPGIAANIFALLREFDETDVDIILAEGLPGQDIGMAIMNRLSKASGYNIIRC